MHSAASSELLVGVDWIVTADLAGAICAVVRGNGIQGLKNDRHFRISHFAFVLFHWPKISYPTSILLRRLGLETIVSPCFFASPWATICLSSCQD
jgi:hypothetical protein